MTIPLTLFSFGFFLLIINALVIELIDFLLGGFRVDSFMWALLFGMLVSIISSVIEAMGSVQVVRFNSMDTLHQKDDADDEFTPYEEV